MAAVINTNLASLFAQNSLMNAQNNLASSVQRLSSGLRINSSKDDASGLAIAQSMQGQINALNFATQNASQAINMTQTADTALGTIQDMMLRMKQLAVEGANDSISTNQKAAVYTEILSLANQIENVSQSSTYNGNHLLNLDEITFSFQVGAGTNNVDDETAYESFVFSALNLTAEGDLMAGLTEALGNLAGLDQSTGDELDATDSFINFQALSNAVDVTIESISGKRATLGAQMNVLSFVSTNLGAQSANLQASRSTVIDTDFSSETAKLTKGQIMQQAATAMLAQANQMPNVILSLLK
jgi:flagellin